MRVLVTATGNAKDVETRHSPSQANGDVNLSRPTAPPPRKIGKTVALDVETMLRIPETDEKISLGAASRSAKHP
jgi:hypothetical protein